MKGIWKATQCVLLVPCHSRKDKTLETIKRTVASRGCREGGVNRWSAEEIQIREPTLCDTIEIDIHH